MKTLVLLFIFYFIETCVIATNANNEPIQAGLLLVRSQKKHKNLNLLNRRYFNVLEGQDGVEGKILSTKKAAENNNVYTAFPPIHVKGAKIDNLPDSPYFPLEKYSDYKPRVKKVLPDFLYKRAIRKKRSAAKPKSKADVIKMQSDQPTTNNKKAAKRSEKEESNKEEQKEKDDKNKKDVKKEKGDKKIKDGDKKAKHNKKGAKVMKSNKRSAKSKLSGKLKPANKSKLGAANPKPKNKLRSKSSKSKPNARSKKKTPKRLRSSGKKKGSAISLRRRTAKPNRRLIGSKAASIENYPYMISIQKDQQHWCSGALLNPRLAITTANCLWKADHINRMSVRACSRYTDRGGQEAKIQKVVQHPQWDVTKGPDKFVDVALIYLDRMISFSDKCHAVDLPSRAMYPAFQDAWITSWGTERPDGVYKRPLTMQVYYAKLLERPKCNNITMQYGVPVTSNFMCLAQTGKKAPCTRDTGAPAVSDGILWGLASWGIRKLCGTERFPSVFSFTASHSNMDFISQATTYLMSEQRGHPHPDRFPSPQVTPHVTEPPQEEDKSYQQHEVSHEKKLF